jgi:phenylacetate-CoA ligase
MDDDHLRDYAAQLRRYRPHLLEGFPSALSHFAGFILDHGIQVPSPAATVVSGETLYTWQRELIKRAFGSAVYNHYGCREFGALARECKAGRGLHVACERILLEEVEVGKSPDGEPLRELLITDLDNIGMPFIRYAIEDVGALDWETCECGLTLPRLTSAIGRTFDVVRAPNGNVIAGTYWTILLKEAGGIRSFRLVQDRVERLRIMVIPDEGFSEATKVYVVDKVKALCGEAIQVEFEVVDSLESLPGGKHRFVVSKVGPAGNGSAGRG